MNTNTFTRTSIDCTIRVLIVENNLDQRADHLQLVELWGYLPVAAVGTGTALLADARYKAQRFRCQVALVDMRLLDDYDPADISGLELAAQLAPTVSIIVSGIDDRRKAVQALKQYKAANFVGKQDNPEALHEAIEEAARAVCACRHNAEIIWPASVDSAQLMRMLIDDESAPVDEINELISRLFPEAHRISLNVVTGPQALYERSAAIRRHSLVCKLQRDDNQAFLVVKISRKDRVEREIYNYLTYIKLRLRSLFVPVMYESNVLWDVGAVAYGFMGNNDADDPDGPYTFRVLYRSTEDIEQIVAPIEHFFDETNWGMWFKADPQPLTESLFAAYDKHWKDALTNLIAQPPLEQLSPCPEVSTALPDPIAWLGAHHQESASIASRLAVSHGDLQGENLFVDTEGHAWPIDFERTGVGPILRDFVELIHDIATHLSQINKNEPGLLYELTVAICAPHAPGEPVPQTALIANSPHASKALRVIQRIQQLAYACTGYTDQRELLWGLLLNSVYVATLVPKNRGRHRKTLLVASVLCGRIEHWEDAEWPPRTWPAVEWIAENQAVIGG
ncbi:MAG TPA: phosphotransferase [Kouleothrix sp.]|nr:phosphotransferase [Kouleothrix sp.]